MRPYSTPLQNCHGRRRHGLPAREQERSGSPMPRRVHALVPRGNSYIAAASCSLRLASMSDQSTQQPLSEDQIETFFREGYIVARALVPAA